MPRVQEIKSILSEPMTVNGNCWEMATTAPLLISLHLLVYFPALRLGQSRRFLHTSKDFLDAYFKPETKRGLQLRVKIGFFLFLDFLLLNLKTR